MSTLVASNLQASGGGGTAATLASINGGPISGARNRIINGDMRIDQRNAGASVTPTTDGTTYPVDRWLARNSQTSKFSAQRSTTVVPPGFSHSLALTSLSAYSIVAADYFAVEHRVEGFNTSDLAWGTASAKAVTLSFWVRSSLTGTFGGSATNNNSFSYPFSYTISSANTWEYKTIAIPGPTSGTWNSDNTLGVAIYFSLGTGSTYSGTAGSWSSNGYVSATGSISVVATNAATFYITGVQLEAGSVATPFERRSYGQELALCQRYYELKNTAMTVNGATQISVSMHYAVTKRATPTITRTGNWNSSGEAGTAVSINDSLSEAHVFNNSTAAGGRFTISAEL